MATALACGRAGHRVFATLRNLSKQGPLREAVAAEGLPVSISILDVDSDESVAACFADIREEAGPIDALVNNAGIERTGAVEDLDLDEFRAVMETNYFGPLRCIKAVLPEMRERQNGVIINVTSVAGKIACAPFAPYTASKYALEAASEALAQEVKTFNVRVAIVEPGIIDTPMARRIEDQPQPSPYPHEQRFSGMFAASLDEPRPPSIVADKILGIIDGDTWQLRHPVGPDAEPFLSWRAGMTDEEWVDLGALDDEGWYQRVKDDFGIDTRPR